MIRKIKNTAWLRYRKHILNREYRDFSSYPDIYKTIWVNPKSIQLVSPTLSREKFKKMGQVFPGNWDQFELSISSTPVGKSLNDRYQRNMKWEETAIYKRALEKISRGEKYWHGCSTIDDIESRCEDVDAMFDSIKDSGYKSREEILGVENRFIIPTRDTLDEVIIDIGRDGNLFLVDGYHRLSISKILDVEEIPVKVCVRHKDWIYHREKIYHSEVDPASCTESSTSHPDLKDI